ncbi:MAG: hypothetical protein AVDCRST_MAG75-3007 [uncultured Propionibacteriaceae bacterium]|uniref:Uncharacterized protein n=1 Tax=uncultured Propionibacteriaceae bacterium TaxID=257457 RepID=A0A6J4PIJ6_9ACTN|nr:MAG: hypothetical protein AVDCRST_MAG75-3007 [uncultured Propionibacteriaceae bacterium]
MDLWTLGLIAVMVIGIALIVFGAVSDRRKNARAAQEILSVPRRTIPHFRPDAEPPHYLSELQARRAPAEPATTLTADERSTVTNEIKAPTTTTVTVGYASRDFVTDPTSSWAVQAAPRVLVCTDTIRTIRELLPVLEKLIMSRTPLVVVAPAIAPDVLATLEVNHIRGLVKLLAMVGADHAQLDAIARRTGATLLSRADLQSGYLPAGYLGQIGRWVSDSNASYLIDTAHQPSPPHDAAADQRGTQPG